MQIWLQSTNGYSILRMYINTLQLFYCWLSYIEASIFLSDANQGEKVLNDTLLQKIKEFRTHIRSQWGGKVMLESYTHMGCIMCKELMDHLHRTECKDTTKI